MKFISVALCAFLTFLSLVEAKDLEAMTIIQKEGQLVFTDGSSYYLFQKDGIFNSGPVSASGRTIQGKWTSNGTRFVIEGQWGWLNGLSQVNDFRRLALDVFPGCTKQAQESSNFYLPMNPKPVVYKCYFVVNELIALNRKK
jgi:hypothetical protein